MDHIMDCSQVHFLKKAIQILILIYIFSMFVSQPSLLNYLDHYMSTFSIKLFHNNTKRNYIFLLFNGILAVILKNSGLKIKSPMNSSYEDSRKEKYHHALEVSEAEFSRKKVEITRKVVKEAEEHGIQNGIQGTVKRTGEEISEKAAEFTKRTEEEEEEEEDERRHSTVAVKYENYEFRLEEVLFDENEEVEEIEEDGMSADELNRKCDEFIKKMREEIKVEFKKKKLIMV